MTSLATSPDGKEALSKAYKTLFCQETHGSAVTTTQNIAESTDMYALRPTVTAVGLVPVLSTVTTKATGRPHHVCNSHG